MRRMSASRLVAGRGRQVEGLQLVLGERADLGPHPTPPGHSGGGDRIGDDQPFTDRPGEERRHEASGTFAPRLGQSGPVSAIIAWWPTVGDGADRGAGRAGGVSLTSAEPGRAPGGRPRAGARSATPGGACRPCGARLEGRRRRPGRFACRATQAAASRRVSNVRLATCCRPDFTTPRQRPAGVFRTLTPRSVQPVQHVLLAVARARLAQPVHPGADSLRAPAAQRRTVDAQRLGDLLRVQHPRQHGLGRAGSSFVPITLSCLPIPDCSCAGWPATGRTRGRGRRPR